MGLFRIASNLGKRLLNIPKWSSYAQFRFMSRGMLNYGRSFFVPKQPMLHETFDEAIRRLSLTEQDLQRRFKELIRLTLLWLVLFIFDIGYALYLAWHGAWLGFFPSIAMALILLSQAFRYQFWAFQIKQRKLGCNLREWLNSNFF